MNLFIAPFCGILAAWVPRDVLNRVYDWCVRHGMNDQRGSDDFHGIRTE